MGTLVDLYNVEVITEMVDTKSLENTGKEEMASPGEAENEGNDAPVSVELGELKARALRDKEILSEIAQNCQTRKSS